MDANDVKDWLVIVTPPGILVVVGLALWKASKYLAEQFVSPLGGPQGKIASFLGATQKAIEEMPQAVRSLDESFAQQQDLMAELVDMHKDPKAPFSTSETNAIARDLMEVKKRTTRMLHKMASKADVDVDSEVEEIKQIMSKY